MNNQSVNHTCRYCGYIGPRHDFEIDHPIPTSRASLYVLLTQSLELVCSGCNREKGDKTPEEYIRWRIFNLRTGKNVNFGPINKNDLFTLLFR